MKDEEEVSQRLSPWWRHAVILTMVFGFTVLIWLAVKSYTDAPPIPAKIIDSASATVLTREDILSGQEVFLKYGLMENGSIWGHGAYLGPDYSAAYLHTLSIDAIQWVARNRFGRDFETLAAREQLEIRADVQHMLKANRFDAKISVLVWTPVEVLSFRQQIARWTEYFSQPLVNGGLPAKYIRNPEELQHLTAFLPGPRGRA